jgi:MFS family permease
MERLKNFLSGRKLSSTSPPPHFLSIRSSKLFILITICLAVFTDIFLYGIIVPVIPFALESRVGIEPSKSQSWTSVLLAVYGAALLVSSPLAGWYADQSSSRRAPLLFGLFALAGATLMLMLARALWLLVLGRILQGFSAAIVWTVGQALLVDTVGQKQIGQTLGWLSLSMSLGVLIAPVLGGVVYEKAGYYAVYYVALGLIILDIVLRLALVEKKIARQWGVEERVEEESVEDRVGGAAITTLDHPSDGSNNLDEKGEEVFESQTPTPEQAVAATQPHSKLPPVLTLLASRRLLAALWGMVVQGSLMTAFDSVVPLYVQETFGWTSTGAGLVFLAVIIPGFIAPVVGWASDRYGPRWLCFGGFMFAIPFWILLILVDHNSLKQKVLFCALLALIGLSLAVVMPPLMAEITYVVEAKEKATPGRYGVNGAYAQAYGLFVTAFAAGSLIGPVWAGYVRDAAGWGTMSWSLGLFCFAGAVPCLIWTGGLITQNNAKTAAERAIGGPVLDSTRTEGDNAV